jgi:hypothetical protein
MNMTLPVVVRSLERNEWKDPSSLEMKFRRSKWMSKSSGIGTFAQLSLWLHLLPLESY